MSNFKHISSAAASTLNYIKGRRKGEIRSMSTGIKKLDNALLKGIEWNKIITIGGLSGAGKSLFLEQLKRGFVDANPNEKFKILSFELEMLAIDQISRNISGKLNKSVKELYSAANKDLTEKDMSDIEKHLEKMSNYPIYYIDHSVTVSSIESSIEEFMTENKMKEKDEGLIVTIDHSLLIDKTGDQKGDKDLIDALYKRLISMKIKSASSDMKIIFLVASQLNRGLESGDRVTNPNLHYPTKNDLFGASSTYYSSDYVIIIHKPAIIEGIGDSYGPQKSNGKALPIFHPTYQKPMVYLHVIKNRMDNNKILAMLDNYENSEVLEVSLP